LKAFVFEGFTHRGEQSKSQMQAGLNTTEQAEKSEQENLTSLDNSQNVYVMMVQSF
jgi:hypothetical protein